MNIGRPCSLLEDDDIARLYTGNARSRVLSVANITKNSTSSFSTVCIRQSYLFTVQCRVRVPGPRHTEAFEHSFPIEVVAPMADADSKAACPSVSEIRGPACH